MDLRLSDVGDDGVRVVHFCVSGDGMCGKGESARAQLVGPKGEGNSPPRALEPSCLRPGDFGARIRGLNSANLPSCTFARRSSTRWCTRDPNPRWPLLSAG